jgi:hypothetical protein
LSASVQEVASIAEAYDFSLSGPCNRTVPEDLCQSEPLGLPPIEDRLDDVRCHACERQESADVGVRDTLLVRKVGDRLPSSPDLPTGTVAAVPASHRRGQGPFRSRVPTAWSMCPEPRPARAVLLRP